MIDHEITRNMLRSKLDKLGPLIIEYKSKISGLEKQKMSLLYLLENFAELADHQLQPTSTQITALLPETQYNSRLTGIELVIEVLRNEHRPMTSKEVFGVVKMVKPGIVKSTVQAYLSRMNKNEKIPVKLIKLEGNFKYMLVESSNLARKPQSFSSQPSEISPSD